MKKVLLVLTLGFGLSMVAQNKPNGNVREVKIETAGNEITPVNSASPQVITPSTPTSVRNTNPINEYSRDDEYRRDNYQYDRRNSYNTRNDVYQGSYEPPTRNEMRYRQGQQCFTEFEINTRPFSLLNGFYGAGLEISTGCKSSFLFDMASGTSTLFDLQATSGMVGLRFYSKTGMVGRYVSTRARFRSYERGDYYGGNLSLMAGYKANWDGVTLSGEFGLGYQGVDGSYLTLPTWAITLGYKI